MSSLRIWLVGWTLLAAACAPTQTTNSGLGTPVRVSVPNTTRYKMMWARPNPTDARRLIICGMAEDTHANNVYGYLFASGDGGATWRQTASDTSTDWVSEEHCAYGANGNAYFTAGESNTDTGNVRHQYGKFQLYVSHDYGMTWRKTVARGFVDWTFDNVLMPAAHSPERLVVFGNSTATIPGKWDLNVPVAFESSDGGRTLQGPFGVPAAKEFAYSGQFAFGTIVLPGDTVVFSAASRSNPRSTSLTGSDRSRFAASENADLFAYSARTKTLRLLSTVRHGKGTWPVPMARDESSGRFHGRIYVGWIATVGKRADATIATSDDNGKTWSSHEILHGSGSEPVLLCHREPTIEGLHFAVNKDGVLGISWVDYRDGMYFVSSRDGGKTFSAPVVIASYPHESSTAYYGRFLEGVAFDEYSGQMTGGATKKRSMLKLISAPGLGVSLRVELVSYSDASDVVADAGGVFHAFWSQPGMEGQSLWTRTIDVAADTGSGAGATSITLPASDMRTDCAGSPHPAFVYPMNNPGRDTTLRSADDISSTLGLRMSNLEYDAARRDAAFDLQIINLSKAPIRGPLAIMATNLHSDFGHAQPLDAIRTFRGGATWNGNSLIGSSGLLPGQRSLPLRLHFHIPDFHVVEPQSVLDVVAMGINVYH